jgi:hypothetical protein
MPGGTSFIADSWDHRIRRLDAATGIITTVAGSGTTGYNGGGYGGDFGPVTDNRIRRVDATTEIITTTAGNGQFGYGGDGGPDR